MTERTILAKQTSVLNYLLAAYVFFIPLWPIIPPLILAVALLALLYFRGLGKNDFSKLLKSPVMLFATFYLMMLLGMLWTNNQSRGLEYLWREIPLLIFPVFFTFFKIDSNTFSMVKKGLLTGSFIACIVCIIHALINYYKSGLIDSFFYTKFSFLLHPTYFSMCLNISVLIIIFDLIKNWNELEKSKRKAQIILATFLLFVIVLLFAKMSLITSILTVVFLLAFEGRKYFQKVRIVQVIFIFVTSFLLTVFLISLSYNRFTQVAEGVGNFNTKEIPQETEYYNSTTIRLVEWKMGFEVFVENWLLGVGTGDIHSATMAKFKEKNFTYGLTHFETPASQYLYTAILLGIGGLLILILMYALPFLYSIKNDYYLYASFLVIFILNSVTDAIMSASGVVIFAMFNSLFFVMILKQKQQVE